MIEKETIQEAIQRLVKAYNPLEIYLFGAYAWGKPDDDSDLELLIVIESSDQKVHKRGYKAFDALLGLEIPKNIIVFTQHEFDQFSQDVTSPIYEIKTRGRSVYARG
ncbi:nucleotidyltransferase domain-containing protein [Candidatus Dependentiae bacterium]|jgi:predicted nucleotidyltransferase|nr:nucleotidyltransferase domain-containing protein [Candidatus Dependentiae bacterium]